VSEGPTPGGAPVRSPLPDHIDVPGLEVRTWRESDVPAMAQAIAENIEHLRPFLPWVAQEPMADEERAQMVSDWERDRLGGGDLVLGIFEGGQVVGGTGAHTNRTDAEDGIEIGYWLRADAQGRGLMTRVVGALTQVLLAHPGITHVEIRHDEANTRSAAIPPRCGYRLVGREERTAQAPGETGSGLVWRIGAEPTLAQ
jgi:ribosomal-protein-serine acetyltransferase